jgi:hypothetical protein
MLYCYLILNDCFPIETNWCKKSDVDWEDILVEYVSCLLLKVNTLEKQKSSFEHENQGA